jgi:hypothetical protein
MGFVFQLAQQGEASWPTNQRSRSRVETSSPSHLQGKFGRGRSERKEKWHALHDAEHHSCVCLPVILHYVVILGAGDPTT